MSTWYKGILISNLVTDRDTAGAFEMVVSKMKEGTEPPPHVHDREDEMFYVLEGAIEVFVGDQCLQVAAGECIFLPKRQPHAFKIRSPEIHMLAFMTPGGFMNATATMATPAQSLVRFLAPDEIAACLPAYR